MDGQSILKRVGPIGPNDVGAVSDDAAPFFMQPRMVT